jgi:hypothetical protein
MKQVLRRTIWLHLIFFGFLHVCISQTIPAGVGSRTANGQKLIREAKRKTSASAVETRSQAASVGVHDIDENNVCRTIETADAVKKYGAAKQQAIRSACLKHSGTDLTGGAAKQDVDSAIASAQGLSCNDLVDDSSSSRLLTYGSAKTMALRSVCALKDSSTTSALMDALVYIDSIPDGANYQDAIAEVKANAPQKDKPLEQLVSDAINAKAQIPSTNCKAVYSSTNKQFYYQWQSFLPATRTNCGDDGVLSFFNVAKNATFGNTLQYLYDPNLGVNQYSSDLVTSTFPQGFQVILAGTATTGKTQVQSQNTSSTTSTPSTTSSPDPVATAVKKMEAGGDFNLRFSYPILSTPPGSTAWLTYFQPALGFTLSSTSGQTTSSGAQTAISSSSQYMFYLPVESYFSTSSIAGDSSNGLTSATLFVDLRAGQEIVSRDFQKSIGVQNRTFFLGQAAAGVVFEGSFRVGMQYFFGPKQAYTLTDSSSGQTTNVNTSVKGFHVVFSYSPSKKSS